MGDLKKDEVASRGKAPAAAVGTPAKGAREFDDF
jgi:hypothetical protein